MNIEQQRKLRNERGSGSSQVQTLRAHQCVCVFACDPLALPACCLLSHVQFPTIQSCGRGIGQRGGNKWVLDISDMVQDTHRHL